MPDENRIIHRSADQARGGETTNIVRWVLGISLLGAILAMSAIWITGAATNDDTLDPPSAAPSAPAGE